MMIPFLSCQDGVLSYFVCCIHFFYTGNFSFHRLGIIMLKGEYFSMPAQITQSKSQLLRGWVCINASRTLHHVHHYALGLVMPLTSTPVSNT